MKRIKSFKQNSVLYMVAVPIGNLKELTPRAIEAIKEASYIFCEDTRNTGMLLSHFNIKKPLISLREHNEITASLKAIELLKEGNTICYVSDAGYPAISDPGKTLVKKAREEGFAVSTISGSNAALNALVSSSIDSSHFYFYGFLESNDKKAKEELFSLKDRSETLILYEAPHRIERTIKILKDILGNRFITIARELTKINEEYVEGYLDELISLDFSSIIGEIVLIIEGNRNESQIDDEAILLRADYLLKKNISLKDVSDIVSYEYKIGKNYVYNLLTKNK